MDYDYFVKKIENKYRSLPKLKQGWRFIYGPKNTLTSNNGIILMGLNPGGGEKVRNDKVPSVESGNAYLTEDWTGKNNNRIHPLQKQIHILYSLIAKETGVLDWKTMLNETFTSNFIPFRSKNFNNLPYRNECVNFSVDLWRELVGVIQPKVIISIGNGKHSSGYYFLKRMFEKLNWKNDEETINIGWKQSNVYISKLMKDKNKILLVGLPHLSTFKFMERDISKEGITKMIKKIGVYLKP